MTEEFDALRRAARGYCDIIEAVGEEEQGWLNKVIRILPRLHAAVSAILELEKSGGQARGGQPGDALFPVQQAASAAR